MDWKQQVKTKINVLEMATRRTLDDIKTTRKNSPNFKSLCDENIAKLTLFNCIKNDNSWKDYESFLQCLDELKENPKIINGNVFDKDNYARYWKSYVMMLKLSDFETF